MYILGINAFHGDSSACLLKDGVVICAAEEERFRRIKHWAGFPSHSIMFCLNDSNITIKDLDYVTISRDPKANFLNKVIYSLKNLVGLGAILRRIMNLRDINSCKDNLADIFNIDTRDIRAVFYNIEHHRSHMASSFFASRFDKSAILSVDGFGDFCSTMSAVGVGNSFDIIDSVNYPHSIGVFYTAATQFLGFPNYGDEYKVMGLAPYGNPEYLSELNQILEFTNDGLFKLNNKYFKHFNSDIAMSWESGSPIIDTLFTNEWENLLGKPRLNNEKLEQWHIDLASSIQKLTENIIFHLLNNLHAKTKLDNICLAGGVAQNSVVIGKILENTPFKKIYVPSAANDAGTSIGSALYLYNKILGKKRMPEITTSYFGVSSSNEEIIHALNKKNVNYIILTDDELFEKVVNRLIDGAVVGWFQGRAEFGSRALGHRSIIVDPRRVDAKDLLNAKIKRREDFRPFAPSVLKESIKKYFLQDDMVPFMEKVFIIRKEMRSMIPAVTHVDGTGRLQTVDSKVSPKYHKLISKFAEKTGLPILLNTSFNENEPIVNLPEEAIDCFLRTEMDILVMENIVVER